MRPLKIVKGFKYFEAQESGEKVLMVTRKHWLPMFSPFVFVFSVSVLLIIFFRLSFGRGVSMGVEMSNSGQVAFELIIILFGLLVSFGGWLMRYLNVLILTDRHIVDVSQKSFFARSVSTLELGNIEDVSIDKNGFLATVMDYGNLKVQTAGELPNFELKSIADPETVQRTIMEAKENFKS